MTHTVQRYNGNRTLQIEAGSPNINVEFDTMIVGDYAIAFDIAALAGIEGEFYINGGGTPAYVLKFTEDGSVQTYLGDSITSYSSQYKNLIVVYHTDTWLFDIYADEQLVISDYNPNEDLNDSYPVNFDKVVTFGFNFKSSENTEVHLDNIVAYPTYIQTPKCVIYDPDAEPPAENKEIVLTDKTTIPSDEPQRELLGNATTLHMRSGVVYKGSDGSKVMLEHLPYCSGGEYMVSTDSIASVFGTEAAVNGDVITVGSAQLTVGSNVMKISAGTVGMGVSPEVKDGTVYVPLKPIATYAFGKSLYYDDTATHYGMIVISDDKFTPPSDSDELQKLNDFCFYFRPTKEKLLADYNASPLKGQHPRLLASEDDFERLKTEVVTNPTKKAWMEQVYNFCEEIKSAPNLKYELRDGVRLLFVAEDFIDYMFTLGMAYKITGDKSYFDTAWKHIESVAGMPDWNPSHHIDVGIMSFGFALAYDWFYDELSDEQKHLMEQAAYNNCLWTINCAVEDSSTAYGTVLHQNNHNVYTNAGVMAICIAMMDVYPAETSKIGADVIRVLEYFMDKFAPVGSYYEGPNYATIAIDYTVRLFSAMYPTLGKLYGVDKAQGFDLTGEYMTHTQSDVAAFSFADSGQGLAYSSGLFWVFDHYGKKGMKDNHAKYSSGAANIANIAQGIIWFSADDESSYESSAALDVHYENEEIITMRNNFDDGQVYVGIKAGDTVYAHSHLDSGSFIMDANGKRWAFDLGADDYNLYYKYSSRDVFRLRAESHNTLLINPDDFPNVKNGCGGASVFPGYVVGSRADVTKYESKENGVITVINMSELYGSELGVSSATRGYFFTDSRRSLVVRDEVKLTKGSDLYWLMYIDSNVEINGNTAILTDKTDSSKKLKVEFLTNASGTIGVEAAVPFPNSPDIPEQNKNAGFYRLYYKVTGSGDINITAKLTPMNMDISESNISTYDVSIDSWSID